MASRKIVLSYVADWLLIFIAIVVALALSAVNPDYHTFSVLDLSISYPFRAAKVPLGLFIFLVIIVPVGFIIVLSLFVPGRPVSRQIWRQRLWEMNAGLLGIGVSFATTTIVFTQVKNLTGKPRPNFLELCQPDVRNITAHTVGGFGHSLSPLWVMVNLEICQQPDKNKLNDGFRSFPSGYTSGDDYLLMCCPVAFAGLWYLSLWLSSKFNVTIPSGSTRQEHIQNDETVEPLVAVDEASESRSVPQEQPTAGPLYLLFLPYIPLGLAIFIGGTRYFDFRNHGFDVLAGAAVGVVTAWFGFRWYHRPTSAGSRAAWSPRSD
ncbi:hypothetical protein NA57DRAFT_34254 [Rhizodiscina lignyota]|uniref:Phosphatidic acid phosphatase type 2/haloperoxidase domain-containing protein n=1 Tax=Rhizodiscina lignyota TaxID=1504668 RepID=A0A9P4ILB3_9PEZI|nr:hypothetical protein NA57DRAFT_34254 [Rhizodiscina lignyota]